MNGKQIGVSANPVRFFQESWAELKKVHPPTKDETIQATVVVFIMMVIFAVLLGVFDIFAGNVMTWIMGIKS